MKKQGFYSKEVWCGRSEALAAFPFDGVVISSKHYGSGHINDTDHRLVLWTV